MSADTNERARGDGKHRLCRHQHVIHIYKTHIPPLTANDSVIQKRHPAVSHSRTVQHSDLVLLPALAAPKAHRTGSYSRPVAVVRIEDRSAQAMMVTGLAVTGLGEVRCKVLGLRICRTFHLEGILVAGIVVAVDAAAEVVGIVLGGFVVGLGIAVAA